MNAVEQLPDGYGERVKIDLQKNKTEALLVNGLALVIMLVLIVIGHLIVPVQALLRLGITKLLLMVIGVLLYLVLHELTHAVCMKYYGAEKVKFGYTGLYAYAGSEAYFKKSSYLTIALAPIVVWGMVLLLLIFLVPPDWFWVVYLIQAFNVSGAAGDLYVTVLFARLPKHILVQDTGTAMTVYAPQSK